MCVLSRWEARPHRALGNGVHSMHPRHIYADRSHKHSVRHLPAGMVCQRDWQHRMRGLRSWALHVGDRGKSHVLGVQSRHPQFGGCWLLLELLARNVPRSAGPSRVSAVFAGQTQNVERCERRLRRLPRKYLRPERRHSHYVRGVSPRPICVRRRSFLC